MSAHEATAVGRLACANMRRHSVHLGRTERENRYPAARPLRGTPRGDLMPTVEFDARLIARGPKGAWVFLDFPVSASKQLGSPGRVPVRGTMNGHPFRISAFPTGDGTHQIAVNKALQSGADAKPGDRVRVVLQVDTEPREVKPPLDLTKALAHAPEAKRNFDALSYGHRKPTWNGSWGQRSRRLGPVASNKHSCVCPRAGDASTESRSSGTAGDRRSRATIRRDDASSGRYALRRLRA